MSNPLRSPAAHESPLAVPAQITSTSLHQFFDISPDALVVVNQAGMIVMVNKIDLSAETVGPVAWMSITDSGIGLSTEEQAQLFTRFYRAHNAMTKVGGGTGLGLVITRSMVEMQGGEMQVSSEPGHSSTFRFTLPLA